MLSFNFNDRPPPLPKPSSECLTVFPYYRATRRAAANNTALQALPEYNAQSMPTAQLGAPPLSLALRIPFQWPGPPLPAAAQQLLVTTPRRQVQQISALPL